MKHVPQTLSPHKPNTVLLSGDPVEAKIESFKVGIYDEIREDVRRYSSIQPVDHVVVEKVDAGWQGLIYSQKDTYLFVFGCTGFTAKQVEGSSDKVLQYGYRLLDLETKATVLQSRVQAARAMAAIVDTVNQPSTPGTGTLGEGTVEEKRFTGPKEDGVRRDLPEPRLRLNTVGASPDRNLAAGGVVFNSKGKILIIKPSGGYGGYDWTFPKGGLEAKEYENFDVGGKEAAAEREVTEETGLTVHIERFLSKVLHDDGGTCYYFSMKVDETVKKQPTDGEVQESKWVTPSQALDLLHEADDLRVLALAVSQISEVISKIDSSHEALVMKASRHYGTMVAFYLPSDLAKKVAILNEEKAKDLHVTLAYLGKALTPKQVAQVHKVVSSLALLLTSVTVTLAGTGRFSASASSEGRDVVYLSVDSPELSAFRELLVSKLRALGLPVAGDHGYTPHVTLKYIPAKSDLVVAHQEPATFEAEHISVAAGPARKDYLFCKTVAKALPRQTKADKEAKASGKGVTPIKASTKVAGAGGKTRYNYPGEGAQAAQPQGGASEQPKEQPDTEMDPIAIPKDGKHQDPPKHTVDLSPLFSVTHMDKDKWRGIAQRFQKESMGERLGFVRYMQAHLKELATKYHLDSDYFGLVYDVLTGANPGVPKSPPSGTK